MTKALKGNCVADTKQPGGVMSEEALAEKEAAVAGEGMTPASRAHMSTHSGFSGHSGGPASTRSLAGAAHRVSMSSASPPTSKRDLDVNGHEQVRFLFDVTRQPNARWSTWLWGQPMSLVKNLYKSDVGLCLCSQPASEVVLLANHAITSMEAFTFGLSLRNRVSKATTRQWTLLG